MFRKTTYLGVFIAFFVLLCTQGACVSEVPKEVYLNLSDTVDYVGEQTCKSCHYDKHKTFSHTGMGQSFGLANKDKSSAEFHQDSVLYDIHSDFYYHPNWESDSLLLHEYRLSLGDTVYHRKEKVDYIIGSGQHTNSHISSSNGYLHQMPFTYYTQNGKLDLPPGFEHGFNTRFNRKIGLECMSCHNSFPDFVLGSENKFDKVPLGISCERCHGPGEVHVAEKMKGVVVDTSTSIDYTIVNPSKLSTELQFDLCSRCHLQGNTVLETGKSFFDFKPGMKLEEVMNVFLPSYSGDDSFIMASHVDRLKMSACFVNSDNQLSCTTCHNPHLSVTQTPKEQFNQACVSCHLDTKHETPVGTECVSCHMPKSGSSDIPHVSVTDHKIAIPTAVSPSQEEKLKEFVGLYCVNNSSPSDLNLAKAYLQQFEKFEQESYYLDSALVYLQSLDEELCVKEWVQYYFFKSEFKELIDWFEQKNFEYRLSQLADASYSNDHAWAWYRVGEAYYRTKQYEKAVHSLKQASSLAPYDLDFQNKYAMALLKVNRLDEAKERFEFVLSENAHFEKVYANYGYLLTLLGDLDKAILVYKKGVALNPDNAQLWLNIAAYYLHNNNHSEAVDALTHVLRIEPNHKRANLLMNQLK